MEKRAKDLPKDYYDIETKEWIEVKEEEDKYER